MKQLLSIRQRENTYRNIIILVVVCSFIFSGVIYFFGHIQAIENKKNIYVLVNDKALVKAQATDITNTTDILTRGAVENMHKLIYEVVPDIGQINKQLKEAMTSSDKYTLNFIDALKQKQFYQVIISQNYFTLLQTDSININYGVTPHKFNYKGTLKIIRQDQKSMRSVETEGYIQDSGRASENNNRGFIVSNIRLLADREIKTEY
jgi:hypothetical protein